MSIPYQISKCCGAVRRSFASCVAQTLEEGDPTTRSTQQANLLSSCPKCGRHADWVWKHSTTDDADITDKGRGPKPEARCCAHCFDPLPANYMDEYCDACAATLRRVKSPSVSSAKSVVQ